MIDRLHISHAGMVKPGLPEAGLNTDLAFYIYLKNRLGSPDLLIQPARTSYFEGEIIEREIYTVDGETLGKARLQIQESPGEGFAGQVYKAVLLETNQPASTAIPFPAAVAIKVLRPRSSWRLSLRDSLFRLSFQTTYPPRLRPAALRSGLIYQEILRAAAAQEFGDPGAVAQPYGYYWDDGIGSYVEIHEWVASRPILYEARDDLFTHVEDGNNTRSPGEMQQKKAFMDRLAGLCRNIGLVGLARQFEWYTLVSQPNVLIRSAGTDRTGLPFTAVDCRPGLAFPFFLPLSPVHARLILDGIRRGRWAYFAEVNMEALEDFLTECPPVQKLTAQLREAEADLQRGLPDFWHRSRQVLTKSALRRSIAHHSVADWRRSGLLDGDTKALLAGSVRFWLYFALESLPWAGRGLARLAGNRHYRRHLSAVLTSSKYRQQTIRAACAADLLSWTAQKRVTIEHTRKLDSSLFRYLLEKTSLSWLPAPLHRLATDPLIRRQALNNNLVQPVRLMFNPADRENWFQEVLVRQMERGVISPLQAGQLRSQMQSRQMQAFLRDFSFTLGLEIFSKTAYLALAGYGFSTGQFWPLILAAIGPVPPSGLARFAYTLAQLAAGLPGIIRRGDHRLFRSRLTGMLLSPWRWVGNLFAPVEMFGYYPEMSLLLADYWVAGLVRGIPVFGGRGSLLEYTLFNLVYNLPLSLYRLLVSRS